MRCTGTDTVGDATKGDDGIEVGTTVSAPCFMVRGRTRWHIPWTTLSKACSGRRVLRNE